MQNAAHSAIVLGIAMHTYVMAVWKLAIGYSKSKSLKEIGAGY